MAVTLRNGYLLSYNFLQLALWLHTIFLIVKVIANFQVEASSGPEIAILYHAVSPSALLAQKLAWMEVLHAMVGLTGGGASAAFVQALGRSAVLLVLVQFCSSARQSLAAPTLIVASACSDIVRYAFYALTILDACPDWLVAARYSVFLVCYPIGIVCEWLLYYVALDEVDALEIGRITLPNPWNFAFDYGIWNRGVLVSYIYFGPSMFLYMLRQRRKKLSPKPMGSPTARDATDEREKTT